MAKKRKDFDCVAMKNAAQAKLRSDFAGMTDDEEREAITRELGASDGLVARKWRRVLQQHETVSSSGGH